MYRMYGDLYGTLTFNGAYAKAARAEHGRAQLQPDKGLETVPTQRNKMIRWAIFCLGLLLVFPISVAKGVIAASSAAGQAAAMALVEPHTKGAEPPK